MTLTIKDLYHRLNTLGMNIFFVVNFYVLIGNFDLDIHFMVSNFIPKKISTNGLSIETFHTHRTQSELPNILQPFLSTKLVKATIRLAALTRKTLC